MYLMLFGLTRKCGLNLQRAKLLCSGSQEKQGGFRLPPGARRDGHYRNVSLKLMDIRALFVDCLHVNLMIKSSAVIKYINIIMIIKTGCFTRQSDDLLCYFKENFIHILNEGTISHIMSQIRARTFFQSNEAE